MEVEGKAVTKTETSGALAEAVLNGEEAVVLRWANLVSWSGQWNS